VWNWLARIVLSIVVIVRLVLAWRAWPWRSDDVSELLRTGAWILLTGAVFLIETSEGAAIACAAVGLAAFLASAYVGRGAPRKSNG
jgi:hypothetical protein